MPSKSQLTGQSDIWDLSDYFPPGEPWKTSYKWYTPGITLTSTPYPHIAREYYSLASAPITFEIRTLLHDYTYDERYTPMPSISSFVIRDTNILYSLNENYSFAPTIQNFSVTIPLKTYDWTEYYSHSPSIPTLTVKDALIAYNVPSDNYSHTPSVQRLTIT